MTTCSMRSVISRTVGWFALFGASLCASTFEVEMPSKVVPDFTALHNRVVPRPLKEAHSYY